MYLRWADLVLLALSSICKILLRCSWYDLSFDEWWPCACSARLFYYRSLHFLKRQIQEDYQLSSTVVSLIFLSLFFGYMVAAAVNNKIYIIFGQRGIATISTWYYIIPFIIIAIYPPFPVVVIFYIIVGFAMAWSIQYGMPGSEI